MTRFTPLLASVVLLACASAPSPRTEAAGAPAMSCDALQRAADSVASRQSDPAAGAAAIAAAFKVSPPVADVGNPTPATPRGDDVPPSGFARMRYLVDAAGRVDTTTIAVLVVNHQAYGAAARRAVARFRFRPATLAPGCPVRFLATQEFRWN